MRVRCAPLDCLFGHKTPYCRVKLREENVPFNIRVYFREIQTLCVRQKLSIHVAAADDHDFVGWQFTRGHISCRYGFLDAMHDMCPC